MDAQRTHTFGDLNSKMAAIVVDSVFHIKFPEVFNLEQFFVENNRESIPVIILFGWAGCQDKYLAKYSQIYEERGYITIRYTPPVIVTFLRHDRLPKLGHKLLKILHDTCLDEHPVFFHVFSNGGAFFYQFVSFKMLEERDFLNVKGVIFDSAPGERRFDSVFKALKTIYGGDTKYKIALAYTLTAFFYFVFIFMAVLKGIVTFKKPQIDPLLLTDEPFTWPQLFIYSKTDELVKFEDVEKFADERERLGVKVRKLCFGNSPHVKHLLTSKELYVKTVFSFLQECMTTERQNSKVLRKSKRSKKNL